MLDGVDGIVATAVPYGVILLGSVVYLLVYRFWWSQKRQHNIFEGDCCPPVRGTGNTIAVRSLATPSFINIHVHYSAHKLGNNVPLIVFLHGLGGELSQFSEQIMHFSHTANVLAIDLVGHGRSEVSQSAAEYSLVEIANHVLQIFNHYRLDSNILVGHSLGCSLIALLYPKICNIVSALVLLACPLTVPRNSWILSYCPLPLLNLMRALDRRGGEYSKSVCRLLNKDAPIELRRRQLQINQRSSSFAVTRVIRNIQSFPCKAHFDAIKCPTLLLYGEQENLVTMEDMIQLNQAIQTSTLTMVPNSAHNSMMENAGLVNAYINRFLIDTAGIKTVDRQYQLLEMSHPGDKWNMKNFEKWKSTDAVSRRCVGTSLFRGMKVMREADDQHSPKELSRRFPNIGLIINISQDQNPPYRPGPIQCKHIPTTSKIPPTASEVSEFIRTVKEYWSSNPTKEVGVHCHYGFNRTGFVICCYLIKELDYSVEQALAAWAEARPPGIKHGHFKDELFLRYNNRR